MSERVPTYNDDTVVLSRLLVFVKLNLLLLQIDRKRQSGQQDPLWAKQSRGQMAYGEMKINHRDTQRVFKTYNDRRKVDGSDLPGSPIAVVAQYEG